MVLMAQPLLCFGASAWGASPTPTQLGRGAENVGSFGHLLHTRRDNLRGESGLEICYAIEREVVRGPGFTSLRRGGW
jgi:hypothetical protein